MKKATKFVGALSKKVRNKLINNHQTNDSFRIRNRSHAILLSSVGFTIFDIGRICRADRDTISSWIDNWNDLGLEGLGDSKKSGRPSTLTPKEQDIAFEIGMRNPKFPHRQIDEIQAVTGKKISLYILKNLLKRKIKPENESN